MLLSKAHLDLREVHCKMQLMELNHLEQLEPLQDQLRDASGRILTLEQDNQRLQAALKQRVGQLEEAAERHLSEVQQLQSAGDRALNAERDTVLLLVCPHLAFSSPAPGSCC